MSCKRKGLDYEVRGTRRVLLAVRDFPIDCGWKRFSSKGLNSLVKSEVSGSTDDSKSNNKSIVPFEMKEELGSETKVELLETFVQDPLDNPRVLSPSEPSVCETTKLQNESAEIVAKTCPPRRWISAFRHFPQGCGRQTPEVSKVAPESIALETNGIEHNRPDVNKAVFRKHGEATRYDERRKNFSSTGKRNILQSKSECLEVKKRKVYENEKANYLNGKFSGRHSMNASQEVAPAYLEFPRNQVIVQALMATRDCPWRQRKRVSKFT